jgi:hypothetical protein
MVKKFPAIMLPNAQLQYLQEPTIGVCPELIESNQHSLYISGIHLNIIFELRITFPK